MREPIRHSVSSGLLSHLLFYGAMAVCLMVDQAASLWVVTNLTPYHPADIIPLLSPLLSFTFVENTGVAFGLFPALGSLFMWLSVAVAVGIVIFRRTIPSGDLWVHVSLGLVAGGAFGNVIDRVLRGYVVDFIDVNLRPFATWPVFNLADSAIVVGVAILLVDSLLAERREVSVHARYSNADCYVRNASGPAPCGRVGDAGSRGHPGPDYGRQCLR